MTGKELVHGAVQNAAMLLLDMLRYQGNCGYNWEVAKCMPDCLAELVPLRRVSTQLYSDGMTLQDVVYVFNAGAAQQLLRKIQYLEFIQDLNTKSYSECEYNFIRKCAEYAQEQHYLER